MTSKPTISKNKKFHQGRYRPRNPSKYVGNPTNIIYRSGWEKAFLQWCDMNRNVLKWGSEELVVPYVSPIDLNIHRYFIDFIIWIRNSNGTIGKFAVEIKPFSQTRPPKVQKKKGITESYKKAVDTYLVNQAKWKAADIYCKSLGMKFVVVTEKELFRKKK